jgi:hypothetical protein
MANCTKCGRSGKEGFKFDELTQATIPKGVECHLSGWVHASFNQTVTLTRDDGVEIYKDTQQGWTDHFKPYKFKTDSENDHTYTITFENSGSQDSRFIFNTTSVGIESKTYGKVTLFQLEDQPDGGDCEWNDTVFTVAWYTEAQHT